MKLNTDKLCYTNFNNNIDNFKYNNQKKSTFNNNIINHKKSIRTFNNIS